jgi:hypothetical protein
MAVAQVVRAIGGRCCRTAGDEQRSSVTCMHTWSICIHGR